MPHDENTFPGGINGNIGQKWVNLNQATKPFYNRLNSTSGRLLKLVWRKKNMLCPFLQSCLESL